MGSERTMANGKDVCDMLHKSMVSQVQGVADNFKCNAPWVSNVYSF